MSDTISIPFKKNSSYSIFGATSSGKTYFVYRFLINIKMMYYENEVPQKIIFCYSVYQSLYDKIKAEIPSVIFFKGLPTTEDIENFQTTHTLLILDDLGEQLVNDINSSLLFTQGCHHKGFSVMRISQNIFEKGKFSRTISINSSYIILLKSPRDINQISILGTQILGSERKRLVEAYENATSDIYGYLIIDLLPFTDANLRLRTNIFPPSEMLIYTPSEYTPPEFIIMDSNNHVE